jgi:hypothetical protein
MFFNPLFCIPIPFVFLHFLLFMCFLFLCSKQARRCAHECYVFSISRNKSSLFLSLACVSDSSIVLQNWSVAAYSYIESSPSFLTTPEESRFISDLEWDCFRVEFNLVTSLYLFYCFVVFEEERTMDDFWRAMMEEEQGMDWEVEATVGDQGQRPMDLEMTTTGKESRGLDFVLDFIEENPIGVTIFPPSLSATPCRRCSEQQQRLGSTQPQGLYHWLHDHRQGLHEDRPRDPGHPSCHQPTAHLTPLRPLPRPQTC